MGFAVQVAEGGIVKASMSANGVITLEPESDIESFALKKWTEAAMISQALDSCRETCMWRGSRLIVYSEAQQAGGV